MTLRARVRCIPVQKAGDNYVLAVDWLRCGLEIPTLDQLGPLMRRAKHVEQGNVLYESRLYRAKIYSSADGDENFSFAVIDDRETVDGGRVELLANEFASYMLALQSRCLYSEFILPEQRGFIESDFVQPNLRSLGEMGRDIQWNELANAHRVMIVGTAGAGKTTLLRRWILNEVKQFAPNVSRLPVYVPLRNWNPEDGVAAHVKRELADLGGEQLAANFDLLATGGQLSLAFDGLDEIPTERRESAILALRTFLDRNSECQTIVATRWGVIPQSLDNFLHVEVRPFNANQVQELVYHKLYEDRSWKSFFRRLVAEPEIFSLAGNPLVLTLLIARYARKEVRPSYMSEVLQVVSRALIDEWDAVRGVVRWKSAELSASRKENYLRLLAHHLSQSDKQTFSTGEVSKLLDRFALQLPALTLLQNLEESTSFITKLPNGEWAFRNRVVRDYFSTLHWIERLASHTETVISELLSRPTQWMITRFRLLAGLSSDPSDLFKSTLAAAPVNNIETAIALSEAMTQRLAIDQSLLDGYGAYVRSVLKAQLENFEIESYEPSRVFLRFKDKGAVGDRAEKIVRLLSVMHRAREGTANNILVVSLRNSNEPILSAISRLIAIDGSFTASVSPSDSQVSISLRVEPDVEIGKPNSVMH